MRTRRDPGRRPMVLAIAAVLVMGAIGHFVLDSARGFDVTCRDVLRMGSQAREATMKEARVPTARRASEAAYYVRACQAPDAGQDLPIGEN